LVAHLIHAADMKHLWANTYDDSGFSLDAQARTAEAVATAVAVSLSAPK
jgi:TolB-like protein